MHKSTTSDFIEKCKNIHGDKYIYTETIYTGSKNKVKIICKQHGIFEQLAYNHILGKGCNICNPNYGDKLGIDRFIEKSNEIHNNEYDYSFVIYKNNNTKVKIKCHKHDIFEQKPRSHLSGQKCPVCQGNKKLTKEDFVNRSSFIFNNKYDYSLSSINGVKSKTIIICPKHGQFTQLVDSHLRGHGCSKCNDSKGEKIISWFLDKHKIQYTTQKMFIGCRDKRSLKFDFYLPDRNLCIEYDGKHHFEVTEYGEDKLKDTIKKDTIKNEFCKSNNITLYRISYKDDLIKQLEIIL